MSKYDSILKAIGETKEAATKAGKKVDGQKPSKTAATGILAGGLGIGGGALAGGAGEGIDNTGTGILKIAVGAIVLYIIANNILDINIGDKL